MCYNSYQNRDIIKCDDVVLTTVLYIIGKLRSSAFSRGVWNCDINIGQGNCNNYLLVCLMPAETQ